MVVGIPSGGIAILGFSGLLHSLFGEGSNETSDYNRGALQQASHEKLKRYVAEVWQSKGYTTEISLDDAEYIDVRAESEQEIVAISVRPRKEENRVSKNAVKRFIDSSREIGPASW